MASNKTRTETDTMGQVALPATALYGASTERAVQNFPISGRPLPPRLIHALGLIKVAAAEVNRDLGRLDRERAELIAKAAGEVARGELDGQFPVDVFQTGSGTSTNTNANEVIANRCSKLAGRPLGSKQPVHPNDHVNLGQSSNDVFPSALHLAAALALRDRLRPALRALRGQLARKARRWDKVVKIGRTHLQDAVPIRLGQEFAGYAAQLQNALRRTDRAIEVMVELPLGGTAVGTGLNTHRAFGAKTCRALRRATRLPLREAADHCEAQAARDGCVEVSGLLKTIAVGFSKIANDIRWLGSGPRCGLGELRLPAIQPGSSIMPGKVNPVICESVVQVACQVVGNDAAITCGGFGGVGSLLELNVAMPLIARNLLESIELLAAAADALRARVIEGLEADVERCRGYVERSLALATALVPDLGYDTAAALAKRAHAEGRSIREQCEHEGLLDPATVGARLDARQMTEPGG